MDTVTGNLLAVERAVGGDGLLNDAAIGATLLELIDSTDFTVTGGLLSIGGVSYAYLSVDADSDIVFLASALAAGYLQGEPVTALDVRGNTTAAWTAYVDLGDSDQPMPAVIPLALVDKFSDDSVQVGSPIQIESDGDGGWRVASLPDQEPVP